jgi:hypothetical protein
MKLGYPIEGEPGKITKQNSQLSKIKIKIKTNSNKKMRVKSTIKAK